MHLTLTFLILLCPNKIQSLFPSAGVESLKSNQPKEPNKAKQFHEKYFMKIFLRKNKIKINLRGVKDFENKNPK